MEALTIAVLAGFFGVFLLLGKIMANFSDLNSALDEIKGFVQTLVTDFGNLADELSGQNVPQETMDKVNAIKDGLTAFDNSLKAADTNPPTV